MEDIKILYIDDSPETALAKYLDNYLHENCNIEYSDIEFKQEEGYESLIGNVDVRSANIVFIDSRLFENRTATTGKFTGEEFKIILKKYFPFIEVIVVTQNEISDDYETVAKYNSQSGLTPEQYYHQTLPKLLEHAIKNICEFRKIASLMEKNENWETVLIEKITNSLKGFGTYDELTKDDIDQMIIAFRELQEKIDGK